MGRFVSKERREKNTRGGEGLQPGKKGKESWGNQPKVDLGVRKPRKRRRKKRNLKTGKEGSTCEDVTLRNLY